ncbi:nitroreductase [Anaerosolibacter carboniphilus]|uniref:Nitroreductase n=1 Tax=Anaerosolibacter carboniphilus TaxID=1417629 RepID=A0A841KWT3_9FIRM|nr:nitroreductase [Anaerosolibacter carboniphilus]
MNINEILKRRSSIRNFDKREVSHNRLTQLVDAGNTSIPLYKDIDVQFRLIHQGAVFAKKIHGYAGYFGIVFDAPHYIVSVSERKEGFLENLGYRMEQLMIKAQEEKIGTCWTEVFHYHDKIKEVLNIRDETKVILAVTPVGYEKENFADKMIKQVEHQGIPRKEIEELIWGREWKAERASKWSERYKRIIDVVRLAPSWANQQPWKFVLHNENMILCVKKESIGGLLSVNMNRIDGGIVMLYFQLLAANEGVRGTWKKLSSIETANLRIPEKYEVVGIFKPIVAT